MKKLFLMAAFAGLLTSAAVANTKGDDKTKGKEKDKKECCKKGAAEGKSCAGEKKATCAKGEEKSCCKKGASAEAGKETKAVESKK